MWWFYCPGSGSVYNQFGSTSLEIICNIQWYMDRKRNLKTKLMDEQTDLLSSGLDVEWSMVILTIGDG